MNKTVKQLLQTIVFFAIGILLVYFQINQLNDSEKTQVVESVQQADFTWIFLAMVVSFFSHFFRAIRWRMLINSTDDQVSRLNAVYAVMIGYLANGFLPRFGEIIRCGVLGRKEKVKIEKLIGTVVAERVFDLFVVVLIVAGALTLQFNLLYDFVNERLFEPFYSRLLPKLIRNALIVIPVLILLFFGLRYLLKRMSVFKRISKKWHSVKESFQEGLFTIIKLRNKLLFLIYTVAIWLCYFFMTYFVFFALDETKHLGIEAGLTVLVSGTLALLIPTPGGLGSYHQFVSNALQLHDVSQSMGVTLSWLIWSANFAVILVAGLLSLLLINFSTNKK